MSYRADKLGDGRTDGRTDGQTQATTIPEGQYWPRVKTRWKFWQMRLTDETKICESYSISWLFLESSSQHKSFEFNFQLLVIISNFIITITMLLKCIQNLHERTSFAHYKNRKSVQNMRHLKASTLTFAYLSSVIDYGSSFRKQFIMNFNWNLVTNPWFAKR